MYEYTKCAPMVMSGSKKKNSMTLGPWSLRFKAQLICSFRLLVVVNIEVKTVQFLDLEGICRRHKYLKNSTIILINVQFSR